MITEYRFRALEARIAALEGKDNDAEQDERDRSRDEITVWLREEASEWEPDDPDYSSPMAARLIEAANLIERLRANEEKLMLQIERAFEIERERCAKVAEEFPTADTYDLARGRHEIAAAIRGRMGTYVNHIILLRRAK